MSKYYTTLDFSNNLYTGFVYDSTTNQEVYRTQPNSNQSVVSRELDSFISKQNFTVAQIPSTINSSTPATIQTTTRRCCGR
jgi:hypothetical protein